MVHISNILVRGKCRFSTLEFYDFCKLHVSFFVIHLKANRNFLKLAEGFIQIDDNHPLDKKEVLYSSTSSKQNISPKNVESVLNRHEKQLNSYYEYIITNYSNNVSKKTVFQTYFKCGIKKKFIKEREQAFNLIRHTALVFLENHACMLIWLLAFNTVNYTHTLCNTNNLASIKVNIIRLCYFKVSINLIRTRRRLLLKLSSYHFYKGLFQSSPRKSPEAQLVKWKYSNLKWVSFQGTSLSNFG